ncbi:MAG: carboxyl-terminal processing protease [Cyclobacteriaceae bacterium]|jgi:carboxyl-terminal processing protease
MKIKKTLTISAIAIIGIASMFSFNNVANDRYFEIVKNLDIFATMYKEVNAYYVDEINPALFMKKGMDAMLGSLDPYTDYIPEDAIENYRTITTGEYGGIGALVDTKNGVSTIVKTYEKSPAAKAGLKTGDQIIEINGIKLQGKTSKEISQLLKGQAKSIVTLTINRFNKSEPFKVDLNHEKITIKNVPYFGMINEEIGYLKLTEFTTEAGKEVAKAVSELKEDGATKIIFDLRGNPGGLLEEAVNVSNVFIPKGKEVVTTRGKLKNWTKAYNSLNEPVDVNIPVVVLIDNGSASASEIVSGVLQDYDRGILVGQRTYGKGLVQQTRPLAYNSQIKITTGKYYIPSGRCIQAIDYSQRNADGSVGKIADSLKSEFKTEAGRLVYDGGGVNPDIQVEPRSLAAVSIALLRNHHIFNYATEYYYTNEGISDPVEFQLTEEEYQSFVSWLSGKNYSYTTKVERNIETLMESAKTENYYPQIDSHIQSLKKAALNNKEQDLTLYKDEIKSLLEQEIARRYYLQRGAIETMFNKDQEILAAVNILNDPSKYSSLLKR